MAGEGWIPGDPWCICDLCGFRYRMSQTLKTWDGYRVCQKDWYPRHPQLDVRGVKDVQAVIDGRSEPPDVFINGNVWDAATGTIVAGDVTGLTVVDPVEVSDL